MRDVRGKEIGVDEARWHLVIRKHRPTYASLRIVGHWFRWRKDSPDGEEKKP